MLFFRISILFILLSEPVYYSLPKSYILDCDELVSRGDNLGLKAVEQLINPLALLYLDTAYAGHIVSTVWNYKQGRYVLKEGLNDSDRTRFIALLDKTDYSYKMDISPVRDDMPFPYNVYKEKKEVLSRESP